MIDVAILILIEQLKDDPEDLEVFLLVLLRLHHRELLELTLKIIGWRLTEDIAMVLSVNMHILSIFTPVNPLLPIFVLFFLYDLFLDTVPELIEALSIWERWWSEFHGPLFLFIVVVILLLYQDLAVVFLGSRLSTT